MAKIYMWDFSGGHYDSCSWWVSRPNSVGGYGVKWSFKNNTNKTIKYADFYFTPINAVNDPVKCSITGISMKGVKVTGPIPPGTSYIDAVCETAWYDFSVTNVEINKIDVTYMDGTSETIVGSDIVFSKPPSSTDMDLLKKFFPISFKAVELKDFIISLIIYVVICIICGAIIGLLSGIPFVGFLFSIIGSLIGVYTTAGTVISILVFVKVLK